MRNSVIRSHSYPFPSIPIHSDPFQFIPSHSQPFEWLRMSFFPVDNMSLEEVDQVEPNGSTALHAATYYNHQDIVKLLLERNCPRIALNRASSDAKFDADSEFQVKIRKKRNFRR